MRVGSIFLSILLFTSIGATAQLTDKTFDLAWTSLKDDTSKVDSLNDLCWSIEDNAIAINCLLKVKSLAEKLNYKRGIAQSLNNIGVAYYNSDKGLEALEFHRQALKVREELGDKKSIAASYGNMGNAYHKSGDKKKAIEFHTKSLTLKEQIWDSIGMAKSYNNIASAYIDIPDYYQAIENGFKAIKIYTAIRERSVHVAKSLTMIGLAYQGLKDFDKALDYFQQALDLNKSLGDRSEIASSLNNIANIYVTLGEESKDLIDKKTKFMFALDNYTKSLDILDGSDEKELIATVYSNIGNIYWNLLDFPQALKYLNKSMDAYRDIDNKNGIALSYNNLSKHFQLQKQFDASNKNALSALALADSIQDAEQIQNACEYLSSNYYQMKQFEKSLFYYKRYIAEKDKLLNVEGAKKLVQEESRMEFEKKEQQLKLEQEKQNAIAEAENKRQRVIIWSAGVGLFLFIVFSAFIYNRFRVTNKQKKIIEEQKGLMEEKNSALEIANAEVAQKNKDITDSIQYAKRIQRALLASDTLLKKNLPEYFVLYKPKDIVSGDFYWANFVNGKFLIITADCTGHGVPGAFMSLLNISLLNEITIQRKITSPDLVLNNVRDQIISILNPEGTETESKDGMDCMLCSFDIKNKKLEFAAANNPLWILKNGSSEIEEFKPDKQPVGFHSVYKPFTLHSTSLEKGDIVYAFTDGFADQFGGPKGKKFKYKQLEELVLANAHLPMNEQKNILEKSFVSWQGDLEQIDDVLVIGVRI